MRKSLTNSLIEDDGNSFDGNYDENASAKSQLEALQIQAWGSLVEDVTVGDHAAKLLFLTNKQATELRIDVDSLCRNFGIVPTPNFVINLQNSRATFPMGARTEAHWRYPGIREEVFADCYNCEIGGLKGLAATDRRLAIFLKECVLQLAIRTKALVIIQEADDCSLSMAFGTICERERRRMVDGRLPFNVLAVGSAHKYINSLENVSGSVAEELKRSSPRWRQSYARIRDVVQKAYGDRPSKWHWVDCPQGCTHYIVVDSVSPDGRYDPEPSKLLTNRLLQQIAVELTSITVATLTNVSYESISKLADVVGRNLPLLLVDTREWDKGQKEPADVGEAFQNLMDREEEMNKAGTCNFYVNSTLAYVHAAAKRHLDNHVARSLSQKGRPLWEVLETLRTKDNEEKKGPDANRKAKPGTWNVLKVFSPNWDGAEEGGGKGGTEDVQEEGGGNVGPPVPSSSTTSDPRDRAGDVSASANQDGGVGAEQGRQEVPHPQPMMGVPAPDLETSQPVMRMQPVMRVAGPDLDMVQRGMRQIGPNGNRVAPAPVGDDVRGELDKEGEQVLRLEKKKLTSDRLYQNVVENLMRLHRRQLRGMAKIQQEHERNRLRDFVLQLRQPRERLQHRGGPPQAPSFVRHGEMADRPSQPTVRPVWAEPEPMAHIPEEAQLYDAHQDEAVPQRPPSTRMLGKLKSLPAVGASEQALTRRAESTAEEEGRRVRQAWARRELERVDAALSRAARRFEGANYHKLGSANFKGEREALWRSLPAKYPDHFCTVDVPFPGESSDADGTRQSWGVSVRLSRVADHGAPQPDRTVPSASRGGRTAGQSIAAQSPALRPPPQAANQLPAVQRDDEELLQHLDEVLDILESEVQDWIGQEWAQEWMVPYCQENGDWSMELMLDAVQVLTSSETYSGNIEDIEGLKKTMTRAARISRLPDRNRLQTLELLKVAWDKVDLFMSAASTYKLVAKTVYLLLLALGLLTALLTTIHLNRADVLSQDVLSRSVVAISIITSLLVSFNAFFQPLVKWQHLRSAALAIDSEVWKFRTRCAVYAGNGNDLAGQGDPQAAEKRLGDFVTAMTEHVLRAANMSETSFLAKLDDIFHSPYLTRPERYRHGQQHFATVEGTFGRSNFGWSRKHAGGVAASTNDEGKICGPKDNLSDDHHSPLDADEYLLLRVKPELEFYQGRLPRYAHQRIVHEFLLLAVAASSTVLAFVDLAQWAAIPTAVAGAATAWNKFAGTDKKLQRFSDTISALDVVLQWWRLQDVSQANLTSITELITRCEDAFHSERQAWVSSSMASAMLSGDREEAKEARKDKKPAPDLPLAAQ